MQPFAVSPTELVRSAATQSAFTDVPRQALRALVTDPKLFENGRHLSAWIGILPENDATGGKVKQKALSKKGDRCLRSLRVNGAMAVVQQAPKRPDKHLWVAKLLDRMSAKRAAIVIANKTARIAWLLIVRGGRLRGRRRARLPDRRSLAMG
jgi:transposase